MARKRKALRPVKVSVKLTLDPERDADLIEAIDQAPSKARLVKDALRGRRASVKTEPAEEDLREQLGDFLM